MAWREMEMLKRRSEELRRAAYFDDVADGLRSAYPGEPRAQSAASCAAHYAALVRAHGTPPADVPKALLAREAA